MIRLRFPAFTQDHTDVLLFNRGFSRFSDDTPTFSCFLTFTQDQQVNNRTSVWSCVKERKQENVGVSSLKRENPLLNTDVLLLNRGFSRFSDDTPTFSCFFCLYTGPHRCTVI
jgi:hypothetical protein